MENMAAGMGNLSKLVEVQSIREVWPKESDFSDWLATDYLNELGILLGLDNIELIERESPVSKFKADIVAQGLDANGQEICIVIENQLEQTNHDHLGKLITYAAGKNARYLVWIVKDAQPEHAAAVSWLNENTTEDVGVFLCEIKLYQIDESKPAPQLVVIERPNDLIKQEKSASMLPKIRPNQSEFMQYLWDNKEITQLKKNRNGMIWPTDSIRYRISFDQRFTTDDCIRISICDLPKDDATIDFLKSQESDIVEKIREDIEWGNGTTWPPSIVIKMDIDDPNRWSEQSGRLFDRLKTLQTTIGEYLEDTESIEKFNNERQYVEETE